MTYLTGKVALDITAGTPNNGRGENNGGVVKKLRVGRDVHLYVSAQAFRGGCGIPFRRASRGPRDTRRPGKEAARPARPDLYLDDDLFGYMKCR